MGYIEKHPQEAQRLIGLNYDQLKQLIKQAIALHMQAQSEAELRKTRIIKKGGGRKTKLYDGRTNIIDSSIFATINHIMSYRTRFANNYLVSSLESVKHYSNDTFNYWFPIHR
ncbi:MAG: hypothetical protein AAF757_01580 [Cyanobacteria bacterium P01_D01_bin.116]